MDKEIFLKREAHQEISNILGGEETLGLRWRPVVSFEEPVKGPSIVWSMCNPEKPILNGLQYYFTRADAEKCLPIVNAALSGHGIDTAKFEIHSKRYDFTHPNLARILEYKDNKSIFTRAAVALGLKNPAKDDVFIDLVRVNDYGGRPSVWEEHNSL